MPPTSAAGAFPDRSSMPTRSSSGNGNPDNGATSAQMNPVTGEMEMPSLLEIGRKAALAAEREAIERVLAQTRWNRRQAAKILRISYKALLNRLKAMEEQSQIQTKQHTA